MKVSLTLSYMWTLSCRPNDDNEEGQNENATKTLSGELEGGKKKKRSKKKQLVSFRECMR